MRWLTVILVVAPLGLAGADAMEAPGRVNTLSNDRWQNNGPYVTPQTSPQVQFVTAAGTIVSTDSVFKHVTVNLDGIGVRDFSLYSATPLTDHFAQINFDDLHPGDHVSIQYNPNTQQVTQIEKQ